MQKIVNNTKKYLTMQTIVNNANFRVNNAKNS